MFSTNLPKMTLGDAAFVSPIPSTQCRSTLISCAKRDSTGSCGKRMHRRSFMTKGLLSAAGALIVPASMAAGSDEIDEGFFSRTYKRIFADVMENTAPEYEIFIGDRKRKLFSNIAAEDVIADIGMGTGPNLKYMPKGVHLFGIEPNRYMWPYASKKADNLSLDLTCVDGLAENLPLDDNSCDVVITTLTLCSVEDLDRAVKEILRVLKPGGKHLFIEHVIASPQRPIYRGAQNLFDPLQVCFADGCHLNRDTGVFLKNVKNPGYSEIDYEEFDALTNTFLDNLVLTAPHVCGVAQKASL